jgi:hypothetical protein
VSAKKVERTTLGPRGAGAVQTSHVTVAPQYPSSADIAVIATAAAQVASAAASYSETNCYATKASATCYPSSAYIPPPEPWDEWVTWSQALVGYAQAALAAAQSAGAAALRIAAVNANATDSAQSVGSSYGAAEPLIASAQGMTTPQGATWTSSDGSQGRYPLACTWKVGGSEDFLFYPAPEFLSAVSRAIQYCQGAVTYAQTAVKQATAAAPAAPPPKETVMSTRHVVGAGANLAACQSWTLGETVSVGQKEFLLTSGIPVSVSALAASGRVTQDTTYTFDGKQYRLVPLGGLTAPVTRVPRANVYDPAGRGMLGMGMNMPLAGASKGKAIAEGALGGAVAAGILGALVGALQGKTLKATLIGAGLGAVAGGGYGYYESRQPAPTS